MFFNFKRYYLYILIKMIKETNTDIQKIIERLLSLKNQKPGKEIKLSE